jgi:hypothetical protein
MSIDGYYKKREHKFVRLPHDMLEAEETPYYVSVNDNMFDLGYFFPTLEEATAFYEEELKEKDRRDPKFPNQRIGHGGCVGLYDHDTRQADPW